MAFSHTLKAAFITLAVLLAGTASYAAAGHDAVRGGVSSSSRPMARPSAVDRPMARPSNLNTSDARAKARAGMSKAARDRMDRATVLGVSRTSKSGH